MLGRWPPGTVVTSLFSDLGSAKVFGASPPLAAGESAARATMSRASEVAVGETDIVFYNLQGEVSWGALPGQRDPSQPCVGRSGTISNVTGSTIFPRHSSHCLVHTGVNSLVL